MFPTKTNQEFEQHRVINPPEFNDPAQISTTVETTGINTENPGKTPQSWIKNEEKRIPITPSICSDRIAANRSKMAHPLDMGSAINTPARNSQVRVNGI